ncbi:hypothetical protein [Paenibacillus sp. KN14-4R]|uniref:hypothetical protein n=1 Tax=Paenibacillus sp. KN14-4R TaxID=3445773 RepID=UPI003F9EF681
MNRFWKLLEWEINRFSKLFLALCSLAVVLQFTGVYVIARGETRRLYRMINEQGVSLESAGTLQIGSFTRSLWFLGPIALCAVVLILYVFFIWYREWWGKNTFAYRLLMLPTSRMNVYLAKFGAIVLFTLGFIGLQIVILVLLNLSFNMLVPDELLSKLSLQEIIREHRELNLLFPRNFLDFLNNYGTGFMSILIVFTAIILERSFRWKGMAAGIGYVVGVSLLCLLPLIVSEIWIPDYFYNIEVFLMGVAARAAVIGVSLWLSAYLLRNKISV